MTMYLLLRNNKQSGPYSFEELKNMGLKAYDLVWLEGKSAAWRYPSEIEELKEFAPAVEEQPFDRFYKRPGGTTIGTTATNTAASTSNGNKDTATIAFQPAASVSSSGESSVLTGKRTIYVTLPAGRPAAAPMRDTPIREIPVREMPVRETPVREIPREIESPRPPEPVTPVTSPIGDYPSLTTRREMASVEFAPHRRSQQKERILRVAGIGVCILALLAAGIFIGLSLNKETLGLQKRIASRTSSPSDTKPAGPVVQPTAVPAANAVSPANTAEKTTAPASGNSVTSPINEKSGLANDAGSTASATGRKVRKQKEKTLTALMPPVQKDSVLAEMPVVTREAVHRTVEEPSSATDSREAAKTAIASEVAVGANHYSVGTFGGINDLQLTVTNRSTYPLDLVVVEVQYIQANKKVYKTENLYFRGIGAGAALMQEAPKSPRGIRVQYKITSISSKELGLSYSGL